MGVYKWSEQLPMFFTKLFSKKNLNILLVLGMAIILAVTLTISVKVYNTASKETKSNQGLQQLEMAKAASLGIQYYLEHLSDDLLTLASYVENMHLNKAFLEANIEHFYRHTYQNTLGAIFVANLNAKYIYTTSETLPQWLTDMLLNAMNELDLMQNPDSVWYSQVVDCDSTSPVQELCMVILSPLKARKTNHEQKSSSEKLDGVVGYLVKVNWLMNRFIRPIQVGVTGFAWVMDQHGRLLFHPRHPDMILRSIYNEDSQCRQCHTSFKKQMDMINHPLDFREYQVANEPAKILAQAAVNLTNEKWMVAVAIDIAEVTSIMRKNFQLYFWLVGITLSGTILGGIIILYINIQRVQAEEQSRQAEEKHLLQEQIHQAAKLASIGELVDSVAHEINTPIGVISAQVNSLMLRQKDLPYKKVYDIVLDQIRRMSNYTKSILRFARDRKFHPQPTDVVDMVEECLNLVEHRFRESNIKVKRKWQTGLPRFKVDRDQMQQVILNLLNNAVDAVGSDGEICIEIKAIENKNKIAAVQFCITDDGPGIKPENIPKLFNPFFTTKPPDKGTGLGLSISRAIVDRHGGQINVESEEGRGSRFLIWIPEENTKE